MLCLSAGQYMVIHSTGMWPLVLLISMVIAGDILEDNDDTELSRAGDDGRIGGVYDTLGYAAPILRLLSYLVGIVCTVLSLKHPSITIRMLLKFI